MKTPNFRLHKAKIENFAPFLIIKIVPILSGSALKEFTLNLGLCQYIILQLSADPVMISINYLKIKNPALTMI